MVLSRTYSKFIALLHRQGLRGLQLVISALLLCSLTGIAQAQNPVTIALTSPATQTNFTINRNSVVLRGTASSPHGIQRVTYHAEPFTARGTATGTTAWEINNLLMVAGTNYVRVTAYDFAGNQNNFLLTIAYQAESTAPQITVTSPLAGQVVTPGSNPLVAWNIAGTADANWVRQYGVLSVSVSLYRNGVKIAPLSDFASGMTNTTIFTFNYPEGDGYQVRIASVEANNTPSRYEGFSGVFRIGASAAPTVTSFAAVTPNGEPGNVITAKLGEPINFRWALGGSAATQQAINQGVGDVTGRDSKIITAAQLGQFVYTLTASNGAGSVTSPPVTVNVVSNNVVNTAEVLHNGINLGSVWPPKPSDYPDTTQLPPYLVQPPSIIPINTGRQLFVDDFLIESSNLTRQFHPATMHPGNPVFSASSAVEKSGEGAMAMPFSNGVFYDPNDRLFKVWYMCGYRINVCYATSTDGVTWNKPSLDVVAGTNVVFKDTKLVDAYTNWIDLDEPNPARRYKMLRTVYTEPDPLEFQLHYSADGIHWGPAVVVNKTLIQDRQSFFYNPFRKKWGLSVKDLLPGSMRTRRYVEHNDLAFALNSVVASKPSTAEMLYADTSKMIRADALDTAHPDDPTFIPNLYAFEAAGYESLMLAQFSILRGNANRPFGRPKLNEVYFGFSRDGFHWHRPNRQAMFSAGTTAGSWNWGNIQPVAGGPLIVGDQMYFYFSGRGGLQANNVGTADSAGATGLATMRRDGFASLNAGSTEGSITTRRVTFDGRYLFVNADLASGGSLCVEVLNESNQAIAPFTKANCQPFNGNTTKRQMTWTGVNDLSALIGQTVKFRFHLKNGKLYAFWVSPTTEGASRGALGAGGPGFASYRDNGSNIAVINEPSLQLAPAVQSVTIGQSVGFTYSVNNASAAAFNPAIPGCAIALNNGAASGTCNMAASAAGQFNYTLQAQGNGKTVSANAAITVTAASDTTPPVLTLTAPTQTVLPAGTTSVKVDVTTNENATCRLSTTDIAFASMQMFTQTGGLAHSYTLPTATGQNYNYLVRCGDAAGNVSTALNVSFSIASLLNNTVAGNALEFDGRTGFVALTTPTAVPQIKEWSIETWVKTTAQPADFQTILGNNSGNDLRLSPGATAGATMSIYTGGFTHFFGQKQLNDGRWHHVVAVRKLDKLSLYVDGQADTDKETKLQEKPINTPSGNTNFALAAIGNRGTPQEWYQGQVDDVRMHNRALTAAEIVTRYNGGTGQPMSNEANLRMGLGFNEPSGAAFDASPNNHVGVLTNGVTRVSSTRNATNGVAPLINNFTVIATTGGTTASSSATIRLGQSVTFAWSAANATTLAIGTTNCQNLAAQGSCQHTPTTTGQFTFTLTASGAGTPATRTVTVNVTIDNTAPTVSINATATQTTAATIRLTGQAADNQGVTAVSFTTDRGKQGAASGTTSWTADVPLEMGANLITVKAVDAAGNQGTANVSITYAPTTVDTTAPVITLTIPNTDTFPLGTRQIALEVRTNENASCRIAADSATPFASMTPFAQTGGLVHQTTLATMDGQIYPRALRCSDAAGNISNVRLLTIRVGIALDVTAPLSLASGEASSTNPK
jgi:hypothetical protein